MLSFSLKNKSEKHGVLYKDTATSSYLYEEKNKANKMQHFILQQKHHTSMFWQGTALWVQLGCRRTFPQQTFNLPANTTKIKDKLMKWEITVTHAGNTFLTLLHTGGVRGFVNALMETVACVLSRLQRPGFTKRLLPSKARERNVSSWIMASTRSRAVQTERKESLVRSPALI